MDPAVAADILGIPAGATADEIEAAYRRRARASHPDRFAGGSATQLAAAATEFVRVADARDTLLRAASSGVVAPPYDGYESRAALPRSWWAFGIWTFFLLVGLLVSSFDFTSPASSWDILFRLAPIGGCSIAFALTGRLGWLIAMAGLALASIVITLVIASFGPLVAIEFLLIPMLGMAALGRSRRRARRAWNGSR